MKVQALILQARLAALSPGFTQLGLFIVYGVPKGHEEL